MERASRSRSSALGQRSEARTHSMELSRFLWVWLSRNEQKPLLGWRTCQDSLCVHRGSVSFPKVPGVSYSGEKNAASLWLRKVCRGWCLSWGLFVPFSWILWWRKVPPAQGEAVLQGNVTLAPWGKPELVCSEFHWGVFREKGTAFMGLGM